MTNEYIEFAITLLTITAYMVLALLAIELFIFATMQLIKYIRKEKHERKSTKYHYTGLDYTE